MAELLPDNLGPTTTLTLPKPSKLCHDILNTLEWIRCFSTYIAAINAKQPHRVPDLIGHLMPITEAYLHYSKDDWIGYDRSLRQIATTKPHVT